MIEPISAYHINCTNCGSKLFPVDPESTNSSDGKTTGEPEDRKADKQCHCCGKKFMVLFGCWYAVYKCKSCREVDSKAKKNIFFLDANKYETHMKMWTNETHWTYEQ